MAIVKGHVNAGNIEIAATMTKAAGELIARADALERDAELTDTKPRKRALR
jgi:hypothetical protein